MADKWAFYRGQCTSWVAYRLNELNGTAFTNSYGGQGPWGDAVNWGPQARKLKIKVNGTPARRQHRLVRAQQGRTRRTRGLRREGQLAQLHS